MVRRVGQAVRNSNVGGICYKAPCSSLPQGRGSLRSSREQACQLTGSWGLPAGVRPRLLGPLASAHPPSPLWLFSSSSSLPLSFLFQSEDGPQTWLPPSSSPHLYIPFPIGPSFRLGLTLLSLSSPPPRPCVLQSPPQTWLRPRRSWAVVLGSTASQGTLRPPHPWLLLSRQGRHCRWNSFGTIGLRVSGQWDCPPQGMGPLSYWDLALCRWGCARAVYRPVRFDYIPLEL